MLVLFGIIEMSLFMRDVVSVSSSVHVGTRMASVAAGAGPATCTPSPCTPPTAPALAQLAANAIQQAGSAMPQNQINWIEVYNANTAGLPDAGGQHDLDVLHRLRQVRLERRQEPVRLLERLVELGLDQRLHQRPAAGCRWA